jgi:HK97 family phage major capsid protein
MSNLPEGFTLPDTFEKSTAMLNDPKEIARWAQAGTFGALQNHHNELGRPKLPEEIADILEAREAQNGTQARIAKDAVIEALREHGVMGNIRRPGQAEAEATVRPARNEYAKRMEDIGFTNLGDFAKEIWHKNTRASRLPKVNDVQNAFSSLDPSSGGYLIPESMDSEIRSLVLEESIVRSRATVISMSTPQMLFPFVDWTTNVGSTFGGWTVTRVTEGAPITPSQARFGRVKLDVTKQVAGAEVPNEMFSDVSSLDGFIRRTLPQAVAFAEDIDFLTGDGAGKPLGAIHANNTALITVAEETNQGNATLLTENILRLYSRMLPTSKSKAVWLVNPTTFLQLQTMSIAVGTGGAPVMLMNLANGPVPTMLGRPVIETEKVPALGAAGDVSFIDFSYYLIGDRPGSALESSPHGQFMNDITEMKLTSRNDGRPWIQSPFTPTNGDTLSPFVTLGARV